MPPILSLHGESEDPSIQNAFSFGQTRTLAGVVFLRTDLKSDRNKQAFLSHVHPQTKPGW